MASLETRVDQECAETARLRAVIEVERCKLHPGLKVPPVSNFDCEKDITVLST